MFKMSTFQMKIPTVSHLYLREGIKVYVFPLFLATSKLDLLLKKGNFYLLFY